jgi:hypothetical protein
MKLNVLLTLALGIFYCLKHCIWTIIKFVTAMWDVFAFANSPE